MDIPESLQEILQSEEAQKALPYLISGGVGAGLGGIMTGGRREAQGEGRIEYLTRLLRNAAITGGLTAGGHALLNTAKDKTVDSFDRENPMFGERRDPATAMVHGLSSAPVTQVGTGLAGLGAYNYGAGKIKAQPHRDTTDTLLKKIRAAGFDVEDAADMGNKARDRPGQFRGMTEKLRADKLRKELAGAPFRESDIERLARGEKVEGMTAEQRAARRPVRKAIKTNMKDMNRLGKQVNKEVGGLLRGAGLSDSSNRFARASRMTGPGRFLTGGTLGGTIRRGGAVGLPMALMAALGNQTAPDSKTVDY